MTEPAVIERALDEPMAIRRADAADLDAVLALERAGFDPASRWSAESWAAEIDGVDRCVLVAVEVGRATKVSEGSRQARPAGFSQSEGSRQARPAGESESEGSRPASAGLAGVATLQLVGDTADLHRVVVAPERRGRGIGRALVEAGLAWVAGRGADRVLLEVEHDNAPALALYRGLGFAELARRTDYYGAGRHALVMQYEITELGS